ncbi:hypothetical protein [Mycolicibacterium hippocampi]|uniref:Uncharacterized protein n=1 Tax=Mycolicibacterium hippocampi TaxID=659824 RepID=A0A7I9ZIX9_9MYCO|nr:hypothetical protein [Mycolicibacterium hippocampi]GFH00970.1 hypothetical protein MHIP_14530 [Mycolicibacterium hippocampi]
MSDRLPDSETQALAWLSGQGDAWGNWPPQALGVVALACIRHDLTEVDYEHMVLRSDLGRQLRDRSEFDRVPSNLDKLLSRQWEWAQDIYEPPVAVDGVRSIQDRARQLMCRVLFASWPSREGITHRMAALALVSVAVDRGAYSFDCSARFLAATAGIQHPKNASRALRALADRGLITLTGRGRSLRKVELHLDWKDKTHTNNTSRDDLFVCSLSAHLRPHDVFTRARGALGPVAGWVHAIRSVMPDRSVSDIAKLLGLSTRTVGRAFTVLDREGLTPAADLDAVADRLGVAGYRESLRSTFAIDQANNLTQRKAWYSAKVQAHIEWDREQEERFAAEREARRQREIRERVARAELGTCPDPFAQTAEWEDYQVRLQARLAELGDQRDLADPGPQKQRRRGQRSRRRTSTTRTEWGML